MSTDPYTRFQLVILRSAREVAESMEPDEFLATACITGRKDGATVIHILEETELSKMRNILKMLFLKEFPNYAALIFSTVMAELPYRDSVHPLNDLAIQMWREFGIDDTPNTREVILAEVSDGTEPHTYSAEVERSPGQPPKLGAWLEIQNIEGTPQRVLTAAFMASKRRRKKRWK